MARTTAARAWVREGSAHWTMERARTALAEFAASGESAAGFARRNGITRQRLYYWAKRVARADASPVVRAEIPKFVAIRLPTSAPVAPSGWVEVAVGDTVVRIRESLDVEQVARLVAAIARQLEGGC